MDFQLHEEKIKYQLLQKLQELGYEYRSDIKTEKDLANNLRVQIEKLNSRKQDFQFKDEEWDLFFIEQITNGELWGVRNRLEITQGEDFQITWKDSDLKFIDKLNYENNFLQVIEIGNYEGQPEAFKHDLLILMNGLPSVWIEIKNKNLKKGFIRDKKNLSAGKYKLLEFTQIFVTTNGKETKYYPVTLRQNEECFEFTTFWTEIDSSSNLRQQVNDPVNFANCFLNQRTIRKILIDFCVLTSTKAKDLRILRPYQIEAVEAIVNRINNSNIPNAGGYIWHTTGSGKTLTSFKAIKLILKKIKGVKKILFVVDRRVLDDQTFREYGKFEDGLASRAINSWDLKRKLRDSKEQIIITTIHKIAKLSKEKEFENYYYPERVVIFIDECHRSQAGEMRERLLEHFRNSHVIGFTGTPIKEGKSKDTDVIFTEELHSYKIGDAFKDKSVLPFNYEYYGDKKGILSDNNRKLSIVKIIIRDFKIKTDRKAFNSIFAVESKQDAIDYYEILRQEIERSNENLKIATVFSIDAETTEEYGEIEKTKTSEEGVQKKPPQECLQYAVDDYNKTFNTSFNIKEEGIQKYRDDIAKRMQNKEIDILIVVNMFLTGFDAPCINTLWLDKEQKRHELIQSCSRTNRIYSNKKIYGNIVSFKDLGEELKSAVNLYSGMNTDIFAPSFQAMYEEYKQIKQDLENYNFVEGDGNWDEETRKNNIDFAKKFEKLSRLHRNLSQNSDFHTQDSEKLEDDVLNSYKNHYFNIKNRLGEEENKDSVSKMMNFPNRSEIEDVEIGLELLDDFIIDLGTICSEVKEINKETDEEKKKMRMNRLLRAVENSEEYKGAKESIEECIAQGNDDIVGNGTQKFDQEILQLSSQYNLSSEKTKSYLKDCKIQKEFPEFSEREIEFLRNKKVSLRDPNLNKKNKEIQEIGEFLFNKFSWIFQDDRDEN